MNIVLLSGGSGKRLWPLSNDILSKQFLKLLKTEKGKPESMVQRVYRQIKANNPTADIFVSCNSNQKEILNIQLTDVETILEPTRRDTFPAIVLSAAYLHFVKGLSLDENFIVCPIDVFAQENYFTSFQKLHETKKLKATNIGLLGVVPTYPSTKYGYILNKKFVEKPSVEDAEKLISQGALWNCGVFALNIRYVLDKASAYLKFESYEQIYDNYNLLPKNSFDYEVSEKEKDIDVVVYQGIWKDLGTWNTLTEEMGSMEHGDDIFCDANSTNVINMLNIPIIVKDVDNAVVIASHDGILVSTKPGTSDLKPLAEKVNYRPMYEQRNWGEYQVLDYKKTDKNSSLIKKIYLQAGKSIEPEKYENRYITYTVISGKGILTVDGADSLLKDGDMVKIEKNQQHTLVAATAMEIIEIQYGKGELNE